MVQGCYSGPSGGVLVALGTPELKSRSATLVLGRGPLTAERYTREPGFITSTRRTLTRMSKVRVWAVSSLLGVW